VDASARAGARGPGRSGRWGSPVELRFAESMVIPASIGAYTLRNTGHRPCKAVKAFVKG
jgi:hypothetical protein